MLTLLLALLMFAVLIFVHESGHFLAAKACHVQVNRFSLGMGPAFWRYQGKETEYSLRVFPIGGFCELEGEDEESDNPRAFNNKKAWEKAVILVAGPFMNVLLALVLMILVMYGVGYATTTLGSIVEGSPAQEVGLEVGDTLVSIDGTKVTSWSDVSTLVNQGEETQHQVVVDRDGSQLVFICGTMESDGRQILGVTAATAHSLKNALIEGPKATFQLTSAMLNVLRQLFTGEVSTSELSGPVGIVYLVDQTARSGLLQLGYLLALLSLNLGVFNLLPFPALDGGRLVFVGIRKITGKAITDSMEAKVTMVGMVCLLGLMVYVTWNDILRLLTGSL